ncbi:hypothetical protein [Agarivorans sp. 3_MG-2023]|nr:hypothetical protein [Agarivorans sp. 3_MG-2023]MDO6716459.1 hypothetical protein [Agarivorans sp. 2_MG-2023]
MLKNDHILYGLMAEYSDIALDICHNRQTLYILLTFLAFDIKGSPES